MKLVKSCFIFGAALLLFCDLCSGLDQITVTGKRVNVRAVASLTSEIVGQVVQGDVLTATGEQRDGMLEILPPVSISVWVYSELVQNGEVAASSVQVRSGPGIGFRSIGKVSKGFAVEALDSKGDWLRIAPPSSCRVWISDEFVSKGNHTIVVEVPKEDSSVEVDPVPLEPIVSGDVVENPTSPPAVQKEQATVIRKPPPLPIVQAAKPRVTRKPPPPMNELADLDPSPSIRRDREIIKITPITPVVSEASTSIKPVVSDTSLETAAVVKKLNLVSRASQGKDVTVSGKICAAGFFPLRRPSRYRLVVESGNSPATTGCYLIGNNNLLSSYSGKSVRVVGKKYWVQGVREPVVLVSEFSETE